jgi:hypothetical protein
VLAGKIALIDIAKGENPTGELAWAWPHAACCAHADRLACGILVGSLA